MTGGKSKIFVIGLDGAPPELIFEKYRTELPHIQWLMQNGIWGKLQSCHPPITVPAWSAMMASQDPGQLGCYGFRNRHDHSYAPLRLTASHAIHVSRVWDVLSQAGKQVVVIGVPQTYPVNPVNGVMVSCFLAPSTQNSYTYPDSIRGEIAAVVGEYMPDVRNFRTPDKARLLEQIYEMTAKRFQVVRHFLREKPWDFFMFVEMGTDRLQHGFWKYSDPTHPQYVVGGQFENVLRDYYRYVDEEIGTVLDLLDDDTIMMLVSDHGAKKMEGGVCLNEWLLANDYLVLKKQPNEITPLPQDEIDWEKTIAWADGGYYGRLFLNVKNREPRGIVELDDYERCRSDLATQIAAIPDHCGQPMSTKVLVPAQLYRQCKGVPPDLLIYFDDLNWRSVGSVGSGALHTFDNDIGPDHANHSSEGMFVMYDPQSSAHGPIDSNPCLLDIAPTMLEKLGIEVPSWMIGRVIV